MATPWSALSETLMSKCGSSDPHGNTTLPGIRANTGASVSGLTVMVCEVVINKPSSVEAVHLRVCVVPAQSSPVTTSSPYCSMVTSPQPEPATGVSNTISEPASMVLSCGTLVNTGPL